MHVARKDGFHKLIRVQTAPLFVGSFHGGNILPPPMRDDAVFKFRMLFKVGIPECTPHVVRSYPATEQSFSRFGHQVVDILTPILFAVRRFEQKHLTVERPLDRRYQVRAEQDFGISVGLPLANANRENGRIPSTLQINIANVFKADIAGFRHSTAEEIEELHPERGSRAELGYTESQLFHCEKRSYNSPLSREVIALEELIENVLGDWIVEENKPKLLFQFGSDLRFNGLW